ncbi:MAG: GNAT family N-acetyltransferase [Candidatus Hodarchaeota archaeon]
MSKINALKTVRISKLTMGDISKIIEMYKNSSDDLKQAFRDPPVLVNKKWLTLMYLSATPLQSLLPWKVHAFVAKNERDAVGFVYITEKRGFKQLGIMVKEGFDGQGIGDRLMDAILRDQSDVSLCVFSTNEKAKSLYRKHGFKTEYKLEYMRKS